VASAASAATSSGALAGQVARAALLLESCQTVTSEAELRLLAHDAPALHDAAAGGALRALVLAAQPKLERAHAAFARVELALSATPTGSGGGASAGAASNERVNAAGALIVAAQTAQVAVKALLSEARQVGLQLPISLEASLPGLSVTAAHVVSGGLSAAAHALQPPAGHSAEGALNEVARAF